MVRWLASLLVLVVVAVPVAGVHAVVNAQSPRPNPVFLSGENPYIALRDAPDGPALARASFWRIHWSRPAPATCAS